MKILKRWWLQEALRFRGAEGEGNPGSGGTPPGEGKQDPPGDGDDDGTGDDDDDDELDEKKFSAKDVEGLKTALKAERTARRAAEKAQRDAKAATAKADEAKTGEESDAKIKAAEDKATKAEARAAKLAEGYRTARVESVISAEAAAQHALDPQDVVDALKAGGFANIDVDQDPDDPTQIEVDEDDVKAAVKKLLKKKAHWVKQTGDGQPSGSKFTPRGGGSNKEADDEALRLKYPALRMHR